MKENFNYQDVPKNYAHCLNTACARTADCLRYQVALRADADEPVFMTVNPVYVAHQKECRYFHADQQLRFALGISHLLDNLPLRQATRVRSTLYKYLGKSKFYRVLNKERLVRPEEIEYICEVFRKEGIKEEPTFDKYIEKYSW